mgnify:CR=1 FL=1
MMSMFQIDLNKESCAVLLRCLSYGESAVSQKELESGVASLIQVNIELIRSQICRELSRTIIQESVENED